MALIDTHTHLDGFARRGELPGVLERARSAGVEKMIAVGTEPADWTSIATSRASTGIVYYTVGLHPCSVEDGLGGGDGADGGFLHRRCAPAGGAR